MIYQHRDGASQSGVIAWWPTVIEANDLVPSRLFLGVNYSKESDPFSI